VSEALNRRRRDGVKTPPSRKDDMPSRRPGRYSAEVLAVAAHEIGKKLLEWVDASIGSSARTTTLEECVEDALDMLEQKRGTIYDGYELARYLEEYHHYSPDSQLVDILEDAWGEITNAHDEAVWDWVSRENVAVPEAYLGKTVNFTFMGERNSGDIIEIKARVAKVVISPEMGHEMKSDKPSAVGIVVDWEDVEELPGLPKWAGELPLGE